MNERGDGNAKNFANLWKNFFTYGMMSKFKDVSKEKEMKTHGTVKKQ
jgi:hypothetical protein